MSAARHTISRELCIDIEHLANEAGATVAYETTGNSHNRATITYRGRSRFITISSTSANFSFYQAVLGDVRRALRDLGYVKPEAAPVSAKPKKKPKAKAPQEQAWDFNRLSPTNRPRHPGEYNGMTSALRAWPEKAN